MSSNFSIGSTPPFCFLQREHFAIYYTPPFTVFQREHFRSATLHRFASSNGSTFLLATLRHLASSNGSTFLLTWTLTWPQERIHNKNLDINSQTYKLFGIYFDENLTFNYHTTQLANKLSRATYCINRAKNILPHKALLSLYHALFHSHLSYCPSIISLTSNSNIQKIFKLQKRSFKSSQTPHIHHSQLLY